MSTPFEYENETNRLDIKLSVDPKDVFLWVHEGRNQAAIHIPNTDAPTIAAALLKTAGHDDLAGYIEAETEREASKKLQARREEIATTYGYAKTDALPAPALALVDRVIELEDAQATA